jgi:hypothetical protein
MDTEVPGLGIRITEKGHKSFVLICRVPGSKDLVRELVIAHSKPGLHKVYDQHAYRDEKRHALALWAARLRRIIEPPTSNVIALRA